MTGSRDKTVRLWNLKDFDENDQISMDFVYRGHSFGITGIDHAAFDLYFATSSMDTSGMFSRFLLADDKLNTNLKTEKKLNCGILKGKLLSDYLLVIKKL